ncbi:MAG: Nudix family hydrolase [Pseudomonadota bacterium]
MTATDADPTQSRPVLEVVAGVLEREDGQVLITQRPPGKAYAGYWEFPGGKVEAGESPRAALVRELAEELDIEVEVAHPWLRRRFDYPHARVDLRFFRIPRWRGEPRGCEAQAVSWERVQAPTVAPMLPANGPILAALALPTVYAITQATELGVRAQLAQLDHALDAGLRLLQVREPGMVPADLAAFGRRVLERAHARGARVLINGDVRLARDLGADGVHLKSAQLAGLDARPDLPLVAASCHDADELARAQALGCDFAVLGPVLPTRSHPGAPVLGWTAFAARVEPLELPVLALGGLVPADLERARSHGAHGIAMQRAAWSGVDLLEDGSHPREGA